MPAKGDSTAKGTSPKSACGAYGHRKAQCKQLDVEMEAKGKGYKGKGKGKGLYYAGTNEENETEDIMDRQEKEESEQQSEETPDDAWWLGSMNVLTREPKTSWTQPMPQKGATNRFAVLAEPDTHDTASTASQATSEAQRKSTGRPTKLGKRKKVSWSQETEWCWYTRVPQTKSVCAIAKDTPRAGFRLGGGCGGLRSEYKAANGTRIPNLGQQKVRFHNEGQVCGMGFQIADVERPLIAASQLAAGGNRVTFKAQGGEIEHIKSGRKMMLVKKGKIYVLRMWVAANAPSFPRPGK